MKGPKIFTVEQVSELALDLEKVFQKVDAIRERIKITKIRLNAVEMIWGEKLQKSDCPDHKEFLHYVSELKQLEEDFNNELAKVGKMGGMVKGVDPGLVDFYGVRDGHLIFLCWKRGEKKVEYYHDLESGFSGRQPL